MAVVVNINGSNYTIPQDNEENWGSNVTSWIQAVSSGLLQKAGGAFTLTAEVTFGDTYGLKSKYFKMISGVVSDNKVINLKAPSTAISASYDLIFPIAQGSQYDVMKFGVSGQLEAGKLTDAHIDNAAAIAVTKLAAVTASRALVSDGSGKVSASSVTATELGYLSGVSSAIQTQLNALVTEDGVLDGRLDTAESDINAIEASVTALDSAAVKLTGAQSISGVKTFNSGIKAEKAVSSTPVAVAALDVDFSAGSIFTKSLNADSTFTFSNMTDGQTVLLLVTETGGTARTLTFPTSVRFPSGSNTASQTASKSDLYSFTKIGSLVYASQLTDMAT